MSVTSIFILLAVLALVYRFFKPKRKDPKIAKKAEGFTENPNAATLLRSEEYIERMRKFHERCNQTNLTWKERLKHHGDEGELKILGHCELVGKSAVYTNVGLVHNAEKCELDVLALCKYGLVHIEVKNYSGCYSPAKDCTFYRPEKWQKLWKNKLTVVRSPAVQAVRAREILQDAFSSIIKDEIPLFSIITFANDKLQISKIVEDRVAICKSETFQDIFEEFVTGKNPEFSEKIDPVIAAKFLAKLQGSGLLPAFYAPETFRCYR
ncbi:nuclease-related domain-containing protein [Maridesulfovibrio zosterae]|uniref:nuclease-related domain-containing protein n=1 Tax=Maridesulfovibrio zosterae TaxID=82171 RepID=UPI000408DAC4|nr:nuclease-related domain-containing protein [Maridesulfovibrio zosterae]